MVALKIALAEARTTRSAFNYWLGAGLLSTDFKETTSGVARKLSRENVLELAMMSVFIDMGSPPKWAQSEIRQWLVHRRGELPNFLVRRHDEADWYPASNMTMDELAGELLPAIKPKYMADDDPRLTEQVAAAFSVINLAEIKKRVDELFDAVGETDDA